MREGEATIGVWLPLALATIVRTLRSTWSEDKAKTSDVLSWFMLPELAAAIRAEENEIEAEETLANFEVLKKRFGG